MHIEGIIVAISHVLRLKSGLLFAIKVLNGTGIHHIVIQGQECARIKSSLNVQTHYHFKDLKHAELKGIKVFIASETSQVVPGLSETNLSDSDNLLLSDIIHNGKTGVPHFLPENIISYEGTVSRVLISNCLYELDRGKVLLCVGHLALVAQDLPVLAEGHAVHVDRAHLIKSSKPFHLVCCGLSAVKIINQTVDFVHNGLNKGSGLIQIVHARGWNFRTFPKLFHFVEALKAHLCPTFLSEDDVENFVFKEDNEQILEVLFGLTEGTPQLQSNRPLIDFLCEDHFCCALDQDGPPCHKSLITIADLHSALDNAPYHDMSSWKFKEVTQQYFQGEVILVVYLSGHVNGTPSMLDKTGRIPVVITRKYRAHTIDKELNLQVPHFGHVVAFSTFKVVSEIYKTTGVQDSYIIVSEQNLVVLTCSPFNFFCSTETTSYESDRRVEPIRSFLSMLVIPKTKQYERSQSGLDFQCSLGSVVISNSVVEMEWKESHTCGTSDSSNSSVSYFEEPNVSLNTMQYLDEKRRKRFIFDSQILVALSTYITLDRIYLVRIPLSVEQDLFEDSLSQGNSTALRLSAARSHYLSEGASIKPLTPSVKQMCPVHSQVQSKFLINQHHKFVLLTEDCICAMTLPKVSSIASVLRSNHQDDIVHVLVKVKGKQIVNNDDIWNSDKGPVCIILLVSDLYDTGSVDSLNVFITPSINASSTVQGLLIDQHLLLIALRVVQSQRGRLYLKATKDTFVLPLDPGMDFVQQCNNMKMEGHRSTLMRFSDIPQESALFDALVTVLKIYSVSFSSRNSDLDSSVTPMDIRATFLVDDGSDQCIAECRDEAVCELLALNCQKPEWLMLYFLARNSVSGLQYELETARHSQSNYSSLLSSGNRLLGFLCQRSQLQQQFIITCRQSPHKSSGGLSRNHIFCTQVKMIKPTDVCLRLLHHLDAKPGATT